MKRIPPRPAAAAPFSKWSEEARRILPAIQLGPVVAVLLAVAVAGRAAFGVESTRASERDCFVTGAELSQWRSRPDLVVVDTRPEEDFRRQRIRGSINAPAYSLRSREYLQSKPLLLIGRTGSGSELGATCRSLRAAGFTKVGVLEGGLGTWAHEVGGMAGAGALGLARVSPGEFARDASFAGWLVVDVSAADGEGPGATEPGRRSTGRNAVRLRREDPKLRSAIRVPLQAGPRFERELNRVVGEHRRQHPTTLVLLIDENGGSYQDVARALGVRAPDTVGTPHVYFLSGGREGFRRYRVRQQQITETAARGCTPSGCGGS